MTQNTIEDVYPLSPMQQGMLFHYIYAPESGIYFEQFTCTIAGDLDPTAFQRAWQQVVERHPALRTAFAWKNPEKLLQIVGRRVVVPLAQQDWRGLPPTEREAKLAAFLQADRAQGLDLAAAPLLRLTLCRIADDAYYFVWSHHHLLLDGWSMSLVLKEVFSYYTAFTHGQSVQLPRPRPYRDYIAWLQRQDLAAAEAFWRGLLHDFSTPTPLGVDQRAPASNGIGGTAERQIRLTEPATAALLTLVRQQRLTLNTLVQGAWALLLSRYSDRDDVLFGATVAGRPPDLPGVEAMIGLFINTLPVRVRVNSSTRLLDWLAQLQAQQVELRQYEYTPLVQVQGWSAVPRGVPLFESIVVFENYPVASSMQENGQRPSLTIQDVWAQEQSNYPLALATGPGSPLLLQLNYDRGRFDATTIERMLGHLRTLLEGIVADPRQRLDALPLLTRAQQHQLLREWNPAAPYPSDPPLVAAAVAAQAARTPDAIALVHGDAHLSYQVVSARAFQLAQLLVQHGVAPDSIVALALDRSLDLAIALLAVLAAGAAVLPLDPAQPALRLAALLADAQPTLLLTHSALLPSLPSLPTPSLCLDQLAAAIARQPALPPTTTLHPANLAYLLYTSGSTGTPKAVLVEQRQLAQLLQSTRPLLACQPGDTLPWLAAPTFDIALLELFGPLISGATLRVVTAAEVLDLAALHHTLAQVTLLHAVPSLLRLLLAPSDQPPIAYPAVRLLLTGGDRVPPDLLAALPQLFPNAVRRVLYGPTEATILTSQALVPAHAPQHDSIGRPLAHLHVHLLDRHGRLVPPGVAGELHIGGAGLSRGYLGRPDLTAARFVPNPWGSGIRYQVSGVTDRAPDTRYPIPDTRLYKTGDRARYTMDGQLRFLGRLDGQVKLRGIRIELGEVMAALRQHPAVRDQVIVTATDAAGETRLVAYVVPTEDEGRTTKDESAPSSSVVRPSSFASELRAFLAERLPSYMLPSAFVLLDALPLTPHGKLDRAALPAANLDRATLANGFAQPRTPTEELVAGIWAQVLGLNRVGANDNFFALGGHSLLATQVIARVQAAFQVALPLRSVFETPTLAALAEQIVRAQHDDGALPPPLVPARRDGPLLLSFAQQRLWFFDQLEPGSPVYNIPAAVRLAGPLNFAALHRSLRTILTRHEALRTTFPSRAGQPVQQVVSTVEALYATVLMLLDLQSLPLEQREPVARALTAAELWQPFDLARGPLVRATLLRLDANDHVLLLTMHHIVSDGWSMGVAVRELATLYTAFSRGETSPLAELPIQYADFAHWQREWMTETALAEQLTYWRAKLTDSPTLDLPTDYPRPPRASFQGASLSIMLAPALSAELLIFSRRTGATLFMTLLAAFQLLLGRTSGQDDVIVGTPIAGRTQRATEDLIGFFVNTLVLRADLAGNPSFRKLLRRVREVCLGAYAHQDVPFEQVVETVAPTRDLSRQPLFQVMFALQNAPLGTLALPDVLLRPIEISRDTTQFDLSLTLEETPAGLIGGILYSTDLFDATTIMRMRRQFATLLASILADPDQAIAALPLLAPAERHHVLYGWNDTATAMPAPRSLPALIAAVVARAPDAIALSADEQQLTYRALDQRANRLAHILRAHGVGPTIPVGVCLTRSLDLIIALLAVLKAGAAYLPIDPAYPAARRAFMLEDSQAPVLITNSIDDLRLTIDDLGRVDTPIVNRKSKIVNVDDLAYVIYTSGSTGTPKGVAIPHQAVAEMIAWQQRTFALCAADRTTQVAGPAFDAAGWEIWPALASGASLHLIDDATRSDPLRLRDWLLTQAITLSFVPTPLTAQLIRLPWPARTRLRMLLTGGEALPHAPATMLPFTLVNNYGPTEVTVVATSGAVPADATATRPPSIGRPIANTQAYVLDDRLQPVPIGVVGELYLGGARLAWGYRGRPDLTAERFVPNPFAEVSGIGCRVSEDKPSDTRYPNPTDWGSGVRGQRSGGIDPAPDTRYPTPDTRLYKTGDRVRYRADGQIEFLGRIDGQVKLRGFRIELGEIATVLRRHPAVRDCAVLAREDIPGETQLVAYVVMTNDDRRGAIYCAPTTNDLRAFLKDQLPDYMLPAAFVSLDALPLTPNGKLDHKALPAPERSGPAEDFVAPSSPAEELLAQAWAELLHIGRVGVHDNFFALGGHSLLATQLIARVRELFAVELPLRTLFEAPTIAGLAEQLHSQQHSGALPPPVQPQPRTDALPLSFAQQRLWFLDQLAPGSSAYHVPIAMRLRGPLDPVGFQHSLRRLIARHETLRTSFPSRDGQPIQLIAPVEDARHIAMLPLLDLQALALAEREAATLELATAEAQRPFNLPHGPLLRATLLRLADDEHIVLLTLHHIIADGWSMAVLIRELTALYRAVTTGQPPTLPPLPIQYADYALWQRHWLHDAPSAEQQSPLQVHLDYWRTQLADLPTLNLPTDAARPAIMSTRGTSQPIELPQHLHAALLTLSRRAGTTLFMTVLAAWQVLLARHSGQTDFPVGAPIAGRTQRATEDLIGFFVNTLVLRADLAGNPSFQALLGRVRAVCLAAYAHQELPFEQIVEALAPVRDLGRQPLIQVVFALQNAPLGSVALPNLTLEPLGIVSSTTKFDLSLELEETPDGLVGSLQYSTDLFDATTIARMLRHFQTLLAAIAVDADQPIATLPMLTPAEQHQLRYDWNPPPLVPAPDAHVADLFVAQVARAPDAIALVVAGVSDERGIRSAELWSPAPSSQHLTYRQLDAHANQIARFLQRHGVGPDVVVAVCLDRSIALLLVLLGIFKAGGVYLPLDPTYPAARLAFMLNDAQAAVLITDSIYDLRLTIDDLGESRASIVNLLTIDDLAASGTPIVNRKSKIVNLTTDWPQIAQQPTDALARPAGGAQLAYMIYTSGTTGTPKAVLVEQRQLISTLQSTRARFALDQTTVMPSIASFAFDIALFELLSAPLVGGTTILVPKALVLDLPAFSRVLGTITFLHMLPGLMRQIVDFQRTSGQAGRYRNLTGVFVGGDLVPSDLVREMQAIFTSAQIYVGYGPTEATIITSMYRVPAGQSLQKHIIGTPLTSAIVRIYDAQRALVPIGVAGELYIGGPAVARGYLRRDALTTERFVADPFADFGFWILDFGLTSIQNPKSKIQNGERLYRSGDLARYLPDGNIEFLGRIDEQVKVRGFRIELGEIATVLQQHPNVRQCVVVARKDGASEQRLVAYVVQGSGDRDQGSGSEDKETRRRGDKEDSDLLVSLSPGLIPQAPSLVTELRAFLSEKLPDYMLPAAFVLLDALPLTTNDKVDLKALPAPDETSLARDSTYIAPRTPTEEVLAGIWGELLGQTAGVHDNFFALGGHSLLATQLIARVRDVFQVELPLRVLFETPTIAGLAEQLYSQQHDGALPPPLQPQPRSDALPLSFAQQRLWFLDQLTPGGSAYHVPIAMRLRGPLDPVAFQRSLNQLIARHETLRTSFPSRDGQPIQLIAPPRPLPLPLLDLQSLALREAVALELATIEAQRPFDLATGPLLRATLLRLAADEHIVLLTLHHIIADGWSMAVLIRELTALYHAATTGQPPALPPLPIQYADYALWQRHWLHDAPSAEQPSPLQMYLDYWRSQLADLPTLNLPTDAPRPAIASVRGASQQITLPLATRAALLTLSRRAGTTLFMTVLAVWQVLLARHSGQTDFPVGAPIAGRTQRATEDLIGFFVNTLVLRADLAGNPSFQTLLSRVRAVCLAAYAHQELPFEQIVDALAPARDLSRQPLFQVLFALQNAPVERLALPSLTLEPLDTVSSTTKFDLSLVLGESADGLSGTIEYCTDLFDATTITRMRRQFQTLLAGILADPDQPIATLPLLTAPERQQTIVEWNTTTTAYPSETCVHTLFEAQASRSPDAVAIVCGAEQLTYGELNRRANQLMRELRGLGVGPDVLVGLCLDRSLDLIIALLGVLKAGGAYLPLDPSYPAERLAFMLEDAQAAVLITDSIYDLRFTIDDLEEANTAIVNRKSKIVNLQTDWPRIAQEYAVNPAPAAIVNRKSKIVNPDNLAYVMYTSGSTGKPKGVSITHRNIVRLVCANNYAHFGTDEVILHLAPIAFDAATFEVWGALLHGARLVIFPDQPLALDDLGRTLLRTGVTTLWLTAGLFQQIVEHQLDALRHVRQLLAGGDVLSSSHVRRLLQALPGCRVINGYGPTENTTFTCCYRVPGANAVAQLLPIGRPINNTQVYVLDRALQPLPIGIPGELYIGGDGLARNYLARPALTAERFVPNPFVGVSGIGYQVSEDKTPDTRHPTPDTRAGIRDQGSDQTAPAPDTRYPTPDTRLYATGDEVRYRPDGSIEFLGRLDQQVKLRGFRIELGEIEAALIQHPAVRESVVLAREDVTGQRRLVAYVVPAATDRTDRIYPVPTTDDLALSPSSIVHRPSSIVQKLRAFLHDRLPDYMIPAAFVLLDELPLTPNGKLDRKALPAPDAIRPEPTDGFIAPRTPAEETLARIWAAVLRIDRVGIHDNFFALGGDSILSIQIIAKAQQAGLRLTPRQVFQHQTIAELAAVISSAPLDATEQGPVTGAVPLTPIQHWFFAQQHPHPEHFNQALLLTVRRPLSATLLEQAVQQLLRHHDALRMRFHLRADGWQQSNADLDQRPIVARIDLAALPAHAQTQAISAAADELQASFDLAAGPLMRVAIFTLGADQPARLLLAVHHLVVDGVSWRIVLEDLQAAYDQLQNGAAISLPPKTTSFQRWAERLADHAQSDALQQELAYWLAPARRRIGRLPISDPGGANTVADTAAVTVALDSQETRALLQAVPQAYRTQINDVLLTALAQVCAAWTDAPALLLDLEGHGREDLFADVDLTRTVGWFTTIYPVLLELPADGDPGAALKAVKEQLRAVPQRGIAYGMLRYLNHDAAQVAQLAALPQAEISFNYLGQIDQVLPTDGLFGAAPEPSGQPQSPQARRSYELEVIAISVGGQLQVSWTYSTQRHDAATITRLADGYLAALRTLIAHCLAPDAGGYTPSDFPLAQLDQATLDQLCGNDRGIEAIYPLAPLQQGILFHTLYEQRSGIYFEQMTGQLAGRLDIAAFQRAWQQVADRHAIFRTAFAWSGLNEPLQIVRERVGVPWLVEDWRSAEPAAQAAQLAAFLRTDAERGVDLGQAPLMRLALFQIAAANYYFVWSHHHLLLDGWSMPIVLNEVLAHYSAFAHGQTIQLPQPRPYRDYIAWLQHQDPAQAAAFWRHMMQDVSAPTLLGIDRPPTSEASQTRYSEQQLQISADTTAALQSLVRGHSLTLNTLVQGAWALLLSRYSDRDDVLFGATVAGRPPELPGVETMVGLFINTVPVRVRVPPATRLLDWLTQLQEQQAEVRQYEYTPLVQIQGWSAVPRGVPLFESIVVFENYPVASAIEEQQGDLDLAIHGVQGQGMTNYPLAVVAAPDVALAVRLAYDSGRFDSAAITRMLGHLQTLIMGMASDPARRLIELPMLTAAEQHQLLVAWNGAQADYPQDRCIHDLFAAQAARTPDTIALVYATNDEPIRVQGSGFRVQEGAVPTPDPRPLNPEPSYLTYRELDERANQLAHHLRERGVGPDVLVGLCMERSPELLIGVFGILKAGGAYVPLDPHYPQERLAFMLDDAQVAVLITDSIDDLRFTIDDLETSQTPIVNRKSKIVNLQTDWPAIARTSTQPPAAIVNRQSKIVNAHNLVYVIYTSGSTGMPKGTLIQHQGLVNFALALAERIRLRHGQRMLQFASFSFDASALQVFPTLISGATLVLHRDPARLANHELLALCEQQRITILDIPAAFWQQWIDDLAARQIALPASVQVYMTGGESIARERLSAWAGMAGQRLQFFSSYGPTEATITTTLFGIASDQVASLTAPQIPLGQLFPNTQLYLLDQQLQPVPIQVTGEVYIGGAGLARGYLNRPDLTAERFVPNPFTQVSGIGYWVLGSEPSDTRYPRPDTRLYKTGDLARYRPDGSIEFLGRRDEQVKIRGFRVELSEIEALLAQHPAVREAVVLLRATGSGDPRLVAYVVPVQRSGIWDQGSEVETARRVVSTPETRPLIPDLRDHLADRLPDYMIPAAFVLLDALPRTPNGKLDRRALPAPDRDRDQARESYVKPRDALELQLAQIWEAILDVRPIGATDNFFELGGHSLLAVRLIAQIQQQFAQNLLLSTLFEGPTIEHLATLLRLHADASAATLVKIKSSGTKRPLFCIHPIGGGVLCYVELARHLDPDQPLYGLQARGLESDEEPFDRIEDMAAHYIDALRAIQPDGPYALGGWSSGGVVAFEMAQQLRRQGQAVDLIALLDTAPPGSDDAGAQPIDDAEIIADLIGAQNLPLPYEAFRELDLDTQLRAVLAAAQKTNILPPDAGIVQIRRFLRVLKANIRALAHYAPQPYPDCIALFKSSAPTDGPDAPAPTAAAQAADPMIGWQALSVEPIAIYAVPGTHETMIAEPHVRVLAEQLQRCLDVSQVAFST